MTALQNPRMLHQRQQHDSAHSTPTKDTSNSRGDRTATSANVTSHHHQQQQNSHHYSNSGALKPGSTSDRSSSSAHSANYSRDKYGRGEARASGDRQLAHHYSQSSTTTSRSQHGSSVAPADGRNGGGSNALVQDRRSMVPSHTEGRPALCFAPCEVAIRRCGKCSVSALTSVHVHSSL